ncbi:MAG: HEAT repeat domain-containing protein [Bacteroidales bacterium]|nr:HEAT repeat domain-containing protein [Bacteroidales bacterium]
MKYFILSCLIIVSAFCVSAQKDKNYNPYQHAREEYIQTGKDIFESYRYTDCEIAKEWIDKYTNMYYSDTSTIPKHHVIWYLGKVNCPEVIDFYIDVISKDTSERVRCDAILYLGWLRAEKSIPFLMEYIHNPISPREKVQIASTLCVMEKYDLAINILDQFCYDENGIVIGDCIWSYYMAGSESAIKFFEYYFKKPESRLGAALKLAQLGVYDKTYPVFIEALKSGDTNKMHIALNGLAAIGDKKSMRLIKEHTKNKNQFIAKRAQNILNYIEMKRREKCDK